MQLIYQYLDYRQYLRDIIAAKRDASASFSFEVLCRRAGDLTKSHLSLILSGKRTLSEEKADALCRALELSDSESRYFRHLVRFNQAKTAEIREFHLNAMLVESRRNVRDNIPTNSYRILNAWHCLAIRELARLPDFDANPKAISERFRGLLSPPEAKRAVRDLVETGLLIEAEDGRLSPSDEALRSTDEVTSLAVRKYHASCLELGQKILGLDEIEAREFGSINLLLKAEDKPRMKEMIKNFREQVLSLSADQNAELAQVTQVNIQMFHLSI